VLSVFPFIFNGQAGVRAVDPLLINVVRSMGGSKRDPRIASDHSRRAALHRRGARIAVGRGLIGILVGEFFAASEGIGYADRPVRRPVLASTRC
jgi:NitT/TauT family transport system permease protein